MRFAEILGQEKSKEKLRETVHAGRVSHAQLFSGKFGFGGLALAIAYAQYISCKNRSPLDSCGECSSCVKFQKLIHPDLHFSFPYNKNDKVKHKETSADDFSQEWREAVLENPYLSLNDWHQKIDISNKQSLINVYESQSIIKKLNLKPYESEYKFLIIWKPERMNMEAANKLLKLIEEPSPKTLIILVAENAENLLTTITSRTQNMSIPPLSEVEIQNHLELAAGSTKDQAEQIAQLADGDLHYALFHLHKSAEEEHFFELFKDWMRACYKADIQAMYKWVEQISQASLGREGQKRFLEYAINLMRESILRHYTENKLQRYFGEEDDFLQKFAPFIHGDNILAITEVLNTAHQHIGRNAYAKIVFMDMSMKFANLLRIKKRTFAS
ncbi:MAG: DNA polymerase III subunit delta' [Vicingaceae bacterium]